LAKVIFGDTDIKQVLACLTLTQKEAYFAKVPCITLDSVSAWPETVEDGWNMVVGKEKSPTNTDGKYYRCSKIF
jgi:hypothetical protein